MMKLILSKENFKNKLCDKSGQGALDTAVFCEPFSNITTFKLCSVPSFPLILVTKNHP